MLYLVMSYNLPGTEVCIILIFLFQNIENFHFHVNCKHKFSLLD